MLNSVSEKSQIWGRVLEQAEQRVDRHVFNSFFLGSQIVSINDDTLLVAVNSHLAATYLSSNFNDLLSDIVTEVTQSNFRLSFITQSELQERQEKAVVEEKPSFFTSSFINPKLTFDTFVVGPCNREAYQAALMIATNPGKLFNPLFLYSKSGLGKTHLLHAIGNYLKENSPFTKVLYTTTDDFVEEFVRSVRGEREIERLRDYFKSIDVLLIDDIQFLAEKARTADMFFTIFNTMINSGKQVVLTSDHHPNQLKGLEARLVTRFNAGLSVNIQTPDKETLLSIIRKKIDVSDLLNIEDFDEEVFNFIAEKFSSNVRELEGGINRLLFYAVNFKRASHIDLALTLEALAQDVDTKETERMLNEERIIEVVADYYNLTVPQLKGKNRTAQLAMARHIAMYLIRTMLDTPFKKIGQTFGGKDHSTVMSAVEKVGKSIKSDHQLSEAINTLQKRLKK